MLMDSPPVVFVIDDDPSVRRAIERLIGTVALDVELFASSEEFLTAQRRDAVSCLVLDVRLPDRSGLDLQRKLAAAQILIPIIFITSHGDIRMSVQAMKAGAVEFLPKPFRDQDLLEAIHLALERDRGRRQQDAELAALREREVVAMVVSGMLNKQIAAQIGTAENTVKVHRSRAMEKMQANSLADLIKMIERLQVPRGNSP
jgi:FixJ family two-component response regulator